MITTYWNGNGKHQAKADMIQELIPFEGSVLDPKLEAMRVLINLYYDWHNNGLGNNHRVTEFLNHSTLKLDLPELTEAIKNDLDFYKDEDADEPEELIMVWDDEDEDADEPEELIMVWDDEIESLLELALDHMIGQF